jgi:hypothetical protein
MRRFLLILALLVYTQVGLPSHAGFVADMKLKSQHEKESKTLYNEVKNVIEKQIVYSNKYNLDGLSGLYSKDFVNCDGFNKEVYFKLVKETWETYPNISYTTKIKNISFSEQYAKVEVYETASATTSGTDLSAGGELHSTANTVYFLAKDADKWLIISEYLLDEKSVLRYGDARFVKMDLYAPPAAASGKYYTASLKVDVPEKSAVVASIGNSKVMYPQVKAEDPFRKMPDDDVLERVFKSNSDNVNEYVVASVGIAKSEVYDKKKVRITMGGLAFIMTRVNVVPENKFVKIEAGL